MLIFAVSCDKKEGKDQIFVQVQLAVFEISGNGSQLDFPVFSGHISMEEIENTVNTTQEIHEKLSKIYDFKHFKSFGLMKWNSLFIPNESINNGVPIFSGLSPDYADEHYNAEILFSSINESTGEFALRISRKDDESYSQSKYQKVRVKSGESVSIGSLYDENRNKGLLFVLSMESIDIKPSTTFQEIESFFNHSKIEQTMPDFVERLLQKSKGMKDWSVSMSTDPNGKDSILTISATFDQVDKMPPEIKAEYVKMLEKKIAKQIDVSKTTDRNFIAIGKRLELLEEISLITENRITKKERDILDRLDAQLNLLKDKPIEKEETQKAYHDLAKQLNDFANKYVTTSQLTDNGKKYVTDLRSKSHPDAKSVPYDVPPQPLSSISPKYPKKAKAEGTEGMVIIQAFVDEFGKVKETIILKGVPNSGLNQAAEKAIKAVDWIPAKHKGNNVGVWISLPINFKLN
jgi:TonB family protein